MEEIIEITFKPAFVKKEAYDAYSDVLNDALDTYLFKQSNKIYMESREQLLKEFGFDNLGKREWGWN